MSAEANKDKIGLSLNGGYLVAAAGGAATMRGFQQQAIVVDGKEQPAMEAFDYVSGLSGGSIPTLLYSFAQNATTEELLDADFCVKDPSEITPQALQRRNPKSLFESTVMSVSLRFAPMFLYGLLCEMFQSIVPLTVWFAFLKPFGIERDQHLSPNSNAKDEDGVVGPRPGVRVVPLLNFSAFGETHDLGKSYADDHKKVVEKLRENHANDFLPPETLWKILQEVGNPNLWIPFVASPSDVRNAVPGKDYKTFQMNTIPTREWGGSGKPCSPEFILGMATNVSSLMGKMKYTQQRNVRLEPDGDPKDMIFGDGGSEDGMGVPALVQRGVRTIVASMWSVGREYGMLYRETKGKGLDGWLKNTSFNCFGDIVSYFGYYNAFRNPDSYKNHIFRDGRARLAKLRQDVDTLYEAGKPIVVSMKGLETVDNPFWGVQGGQIVDLTIICYTLPKEFAEKIPIESVPPGLDDNGKPKPKIDENGKFTNAEFKTFPEMDATSNFETKTTYGMYLRFLSLTRGQANMSAYLGSWVINEAWEGLSVDGKQIFGGFKEILQK